MSDEDGENNKVDQRLRILAAADEEKFKRRTEIQQGDTFTTVCCMICLVFFFFCWVFAVLPLAAHFVEVILSFWGLRL